jgi:hypothetical protein
MAGRGIAGYVILGTLLVLSAPSVGRAGAGPAWLPHYDLDIRLDPEHHQALVRERVTFINHLACPVPNLVFNVSSSYKIPDKDVGFLAKMLEILRLAPSEALSFGDSPCQMRRASLVCQAGPPTVRGQMPERVPQSLPLPAPVVELPYHYQEKIPTALEVALPRPVGPNESVTIDLEFVIRLPPRQGRWGQWKGVTFLVQWLPVLAFQDSHGWHPAPFIPWHLPFYNEAGVYTGRVVLPCDQRLICTCPELASQDLGNGQRLVVLGERTARDFALFCSNQFHEFVGQAGPVRVRCLALPGHEWYGQEMVRIACEAIPIYTKWFGPYPYEDFTIVESYFGWNGNQCGALVMIDSRIFDMPHLALPFVDELVTHEICHQWWYNVVGNDGYAETWMDEALATYFAHRLDDLKFGKNNAMLHYPKCFAWMPNIYRDDYKNYSLCGTLGRGENTACVQPIPGMQHLVNLNSMCYDKGSRIVGLIEERLGEAAFLDFMRHLYAKYFFRILHVAEFQAELEAYTGASWDQFFKDWLYGKGLSDWCIEKVIKHKECRKAGKTQNGNVKAAFLPSCIPHSSIFHYTIFVRQKAEINEPTTVGICLDGSDQFPLRIPIVPGIVQADYSDPPATVISLPDNGFRIEVDLPAKPTQIMVDPDELIVDKNPCNNTWKPRCRFRVTPLYNLLDETDITNRYDRWNFIVGPWVYGGSQNDPWFTRSEMFGFRAGVYRTQDFSGGAYVAYRTDDRNIVAGVEGMWDHFPWTHTQVGFLAERTLTDNSTSNGSNFSRGLVYGRYVFTYGDSLYLPPMHYVEMFGAILDNPLPEPVETVPGAVPFDHQTSVGVHYHVDYLTPYWEPEGGFRFDATYETGIPIFGEQKAFNGVMSQLSYVKMMPDLGGPECLAPVTHWFSQTKLALRAYGATALPDNGNFFPLGGGLRFRGFDLAQRQGSTVWVGSAEWRVPLVRDLKCDCCDHVAGLRNLYGALFYDAGNAYVNGHQVGDVAHAVGGGLRMDVVWFGLVERTTLRFDVAKTVNAATPLQFWFGIQYPF